VRIRGSLTLAPAGRPVAITAGPFDALPEGAFGVCLEVQAEKAWLAEVLLPTADFGLPDAAALHEAIATVLAQMLAQPDRPIHVGCRAGVGRTGLFLACLAKAIRWISCAPITCRTRRRRRRNRRWQGRFAGPDFRRS